MQHDLKSILKQFQIGGKLSDAQPYGSGHINDTYAAVYEQDGVSVRYILQRINHSIFKNPPELTENIVRVTRHIRGKLEAEGASDILRRVLTVIETSDGKGYYKDTNENYWRVYDFIENGKTYDMIQSPELAYEAARMFGGFQKMLVDLPEPALHETIPDFHNGPRRFGQFQQALKNDVCGRAKNAKAEITFLLEHAQIFDVLPKLVSSGEIPIRVTHNDTKINNVIFDNKTGEALCVIDLDTVMPGLSLYDFGDMVRTATSPAEEDERDLSKVNMQMPLFEKLVRGFIEGAGGGLTPAEKQHLPFGGKMITLEQLARFLADYLAGDVYYKIHREGHNLDRTRTQMKLVQSIIEQEDEMNALVE